MGTWLIIADLLTLLHGDDIPVPEGTLRRWAAGPDVRRARFGGVTYYRVVDMRRQMLAWAQRNQRRSA